MTTKELQTELDDFLLRFPDTRFMDVFAADINGILRGKRIQTNDFSSVFGGHFQNHPTSRGCNFVATDLILISC